jgi:hypothetical protein
MDNHRSREAEFAKICQLSCWLEYVAFFAACAMGSLYLFVQYSVTHAIIDFPFIFILLIATTILLLGEWTTRRHFFNSGLQFFIYSLAPCAETSAIDLHRTTSMRLFKSCNRIATGLGWGAVLGFAPYVLNVWPTNWLLQVLLSSFMFFVNYITGNAVFSLVQFLLNTQQLSSIMAIDVWNSRNPSTAFYMRSVLEVAIFSCIYTSVSMSSILFSKLDRTGVVYAYVALSFSLVALSALYPYSLIVLRLIRAKRELCARISVRLHTLTEDILNSSDRANTEAKMQEMRPLLELKRSVQELGILPFRTLGISATAVMAFVLSHPLLLDWALRANSVLKPAAILGVLNNASH